MTVETRKYLCVDIETMADLAPVLSGIFALLVLSYFVYRDASARGSEYAIYWGIAMVFTNIIVPAGFLYYLYIRRRIPTSDRKRIEWG